MRLTKTQRAKLQAVLDLIDTSGLNSGMVVRLLEARSALEDAKQSRAEMMADVAADEGAEDDDRKQAQGWSAADEVEGNRDAELDDPRDTIYFNAECINDMGRAFFGRKWSKAAE